MLILFKSFVMVAILHKLQQSEICPSSMLLLPHGFVLTFAHLTDDRVFHLRKLLKMIVQLLENSSFLLDDFRSFNVVPLQSVQQSLTKFDLVDFRVS